MTDFMRKDAGKGVRKLTVTVELDLDTGLTAVTTNIADPSVMLRIMGQGMEIWANDLMKKQVAVAGAVVDPSKPNGHRLLTLPKH